MCLSPSQLEQRKPQINIDLFVKHFFPEKVRSLEAGDKRGASESSESDRGDSIDGARTTGHSRDNSDQIGGSPLKRGTHTDGMTTSIGATSTFSGSVKS